MPETNLAEYTGQIVLSIIVIAGQVFSSWDKWRISKALEKAEELAKDKAARVEAALQKAEELAKTEARRVEAALLAAQEAATKSLAELTEMRAAEAAQKIDAVHAEVIANTAISEKAFVEANNSNAKIQALQVAIGVNQDAIAAGQQQPVQQVEIVQPASRPVPVTQVEGSGPPR